MQEVLESGHHDGEGGIVYMHSHISIFSKMNACIHLLQVYFALLLMASMLTTLDAIEVGDQVCMSGYIMDIFCIELGVLLDSPNTMTLEEPENHSFHCLLDVGACRNSGYVVLGEKDPDSSLHCLGLRLEETSTVVAAGRAAGSAERSSTHFTCRTCSGDASKPVAGYRATVKGTVKELGDGSDGVTGQPLLNNIEMLDFDVGCGEEELVTVKNIEGECQVISSRTITSLSTTSTPSLESTVIPSATIVQEEITSSPTLPQELTTFSPTFAPTFELSSAPSISVTQQQTTTYSPTAASTVASSTNPSQSVTETPTVPTSNPAVSSLSPSVFQEGITSSPSVSLSNSPTFAPTFESSSAPSISPTQQQTTTYSPTAASTTVSSTTPSESITEKPTAPTSDLVDSSSSPSVEITTSVSNPPSDIVTSSKPSIESPPDCTLQFCERILSDDYILRYRVNVEDASITMEAIYNGEAWIAVAFSEDDMMPGSDAVIGSPELGNVPLKYRLLARTPVVDSAIQVMAEEDQTLIDAKVELRDGQTVMSFTKYLSEPGQIEINLGINNMLWAYGRSNTLSYHAARSPFTLDLSISTIDDVAISAPPSFESSVAPSTASTPPLQMGCNSWPDEAWLQPNFCSSRFIDGLSRPRGLHIDQSTDEILLVERGTSRVVRLAQSNDDGVNVMTVPIPNTEGLGLNHGIELAGGYLYASSMTTVFRWPYSNGMTGNTEEVIVGMEPGGHFTRTLAFDADGRWLYVAIGSKNNVDADSSRSRIRRFDMSSWDGVAPFDFNNDGQLFADGLRNEVGLAFDVHGDLWGVENGADNLHREDLGGDIHNDNPSEELNRFREDQIGQSWGYPYCWSEYCLPQENGGSGVKGANTRWAWPSFIDAGYTDEWCRENTNESVMSMPAHSAPLGMTFYKWKDLSQDESCEGGFPKSMDNYIFIAFHGSWNRDVPTGYKVVFVPMDDEGNPTHQPIDLFRHAGDGAKWPGNGFRPVDVQFDSCGRLYITEDRTGSVVQVRYDGDYIDDYEPIEKDVADGPSCVAPGERVGFTTLLTESNSSVLLDAPPDEPSPNESANESSNHGQDSNPALEIDEFVDNVDDNPTSNSKQLLIWWPLHVMLLLFFKQFFL